MGLLLVLLLVLVLERPKWAFESMDRWWPVGNPVVDASVSAAVALACAVVSILGAILSVRTQLEHQSPQIQPTPSPPALIPSPVEAPARIENQPSARQESFGRRGQAGDTYASTAHWYPGMFQTFRKALTTPCPTKPSILPYFEEVYLRAPLLQWESSVWNLKTNVQGQPALPEGGSRKQG